MHKIIINLCHFLIRTVRCLHLNPVFSLHVHINIEAYVWTRDIISMPCSLSVVSPTSRKTGPSTPDNHIISNSQPFLTSHEYKFASHCPEHTVLNHWVIWWYVNASSKDLITVSSCVRGPNYWLAYLCVWYLIISLFVVCLWCIYNNNFHW